MSSSRSYYTFDSLSLRAKNAAVSLSSSRFPSFVLTVLADNAAFSISAVFILLFILVCTDFVPVPYFDFSKPNSGAVHPVKKKNSKRLVYELVRMV